MRMWLLDLEFVVQLYGLHLLVGLAGGIGERPQSDKGDCGHSLNVDRWGLIVEKSCEKKVEPVGRWRRENKSDW